MRSASILLLIACTAVEADEVSREFLAHPAAGDKKIELFWIRPAAEGPVPAVLIIHGHQEGQRPGGEAYVRSGDLRAMAQSGYVAAALSQPGYGRSDGPADYCGPYTHDAALAALAFLRRQPFVKRDKVAIYGYSRGAIVAAMVATRDPELAAAVLGAGAYDFFTWYPAPIPGINRLIQREAGLSPEAFRARSALHHAERIRAPVLLLHGGNDERIPVAQARAFAEKLAAVGVPVTLKIFAREGHGIPRSELYQEINPFLAAALR